MAQIDAAAAGKPRRPGLPKRHMQPAQTVSLCSFLLSGVSHTEEKDDEIILVGRKSKQGTKDIRL